MKKHRFKGVGVAPISNIEPIFIFVQTNSVHKS